ncbi:MAG: glycosyltransferase family 4 protein [Solibacillus sp.]
MEKMKVLFVASVYRHLTTFHIPYMKYFQSNGYDVWAASIGDEDKKILTDIGVNCLDIPFSRNPVDSKNIESFKLLKMLFKKDQFELVHVHTPVAALVTRAAFKGSNYGKIIYTAHGFHFFKGASKKNWLLYYPLEKIAARWTDHLITINEEDYVNAQKFLPKDKVSFVHGVGVEPFAETLNAEQKLQLKKELNLPLDSIVIAYVAELNTNKNHQFILRNWEKIKEINFKYELLIIGTGEVELELQEYVRTNHLQGIHFLGFRRDVPRLLQISDVVTLLSLREGLPKSIMEAMAVGLPCVVTNTRGLRDLIQNNETGYIIEPDDDGKLLDAFNNLTEVQLRVALGGKGRLLAEQFFLENVLKEYITIYNNVLNTN